ncbi:MAG: TetR/AcrR family transcriptional regulator [Sporichthyaceae bacterium]
MNTHPLLGARSYAPEATPSGSTRSRHDYFLAAYELLAQSGSDGVTVDALCRRLGVTKGSFRWHFEGMPAFTDALADHWAQHHEERLAAVTIEPDPVKRLGSLLSTLLCEPDPADAALRAWAHSEPAFRDGLRRIDGQRQQAFATSILEATGDAAADLLGDAMLGLAIGLHQNPPGFDPETATRLVLAFARRYLRVDAEVQVTDNQPVIVIRRPG